METLKQILHVCSLLMRRLGAAGPKWEAFCYHFELPPRRVSVLARDKEGVSRAARRGQVSLPILLRLHYGSIIHVGSNKHVLTISLLWSFGNWKWEWSKSVVLFRASLNFFHQFASSHHLSSDNGLVLLLCELLFQHSCECKPKDKKWERPGNKASGDKASKQAQFILLVCPAPPVPSGTIVSMILFK